MNIDYKILEQNKNKILNNEVNEDEIDKIQERLTNEFDFEDRMTLYFMGFTSESTSYQDQIKKYSPMFSGFKENVEQIVYPWHAEKTFYGFGDLTKTLWNNWTSKSTCKFNTNYRKALKNSFSDSEELFNNFEDSRIDQSPELNFVGYSLGTQFIFNLLLKMQLANDGDKGKCDSDYKVNNVVLMAGVLSANWLYSKLGDFFKMG